MVASRSGTNLDTESVRVKPRKRAWPRHLLGNPMAAKAPSPKAKRKKPRTGPAPACTPSMLSMATQNLINMVGVCTVSGAVLLTLLTARHF
jgi:hypothetical protein